jgi:hypothetical protein
VLTLGCALATGCGRVGLDARPAADALAPADAATSSAFVQGAAKRTASSTTTLALPLAPTRAGDLLVVAVAQESSTTAIVTAIADGSAGDAFASANARSIDSNCANTAEIWYAPNIAAGATQVTITMDAAVTYNAWVAEFSGATTLVASAHADSHPSTTTIDAPPIAVSTGAIVVDAEVTCGAASAIDASSPFTGLQILNGEDLAYYIATAPGSYGASWAYGGGTWDASSAAFR